LWLKKIREKLRPLLSFTHYTNNYLASIQLYE
jgi:hypothetical protein